jgi:uncharacterized protein YutE (UPF0331/DUF86 family)
MSAIMTKSENNKDLKNPTTRTKGRNRRRRSRTLRALGIAAPLLLILFGILHSLLPKMFSLDWQSVTLLVLGVVLFFLPMRKLAGMIKKLEVGSFKLELKEEGRELTETVTEAEQHVEETGSKDQPPQAELPLTPPEKDEEQAPPNEGSELGTLAGESGRGRAHRPRRHYRSDFDAQSLLNYEIDQLAAVSPRAALIRLATAIEQMTVDMATPFKPEGKQRIRSFTQAIDVLQRAKKISPYLGEALSQFWRLRNKLVHVSAAVGDDVVTSATNDGLRLFAILEKISRQRPI